MTLGISKKREYREIPWARREVKIKKIMRADLGTWSMESQGRIVRAPKSAFSL